MSNPDSKADSSIQEGERLLTAMRECAAECGWNALAVKQAAIQAGLSQADLALIAPFGARDPAYALVGSLIEDWSKQADIHTRDQLQEMDIEAMRVRERVAMGVKTRIGVLAPHKEAARAAVLASVAPWRALLAPSLLFRAADNIWSAIGDPSTDWNWYSKRLILSGVLASTFSVWLEQPDEAQAWQKLDKEIDGVMQFERFKGKIRNWTANCPDPLNIFGHRRPAP